jgi:hypothetical protein
METQTRTCRVCKETKPLFDFVANKQSKLGYTRKCKACEKEWRHSYYLENKEYILSRGIIYRETTVNWYSRSVVNRLRYVIQLGKKRAREKQIEWNIELPFLLQLWEKQQSKCAYSGVPFTYEDNHPHTVSLDRIDSQKGYTEDNVQFVCTIVNYIKQRFTEEQFFSFCSLITQQNKDKYTLST